MHKYIIRIFIFGAVLYSPVLLIAQDTTKSELKYPFRDNPGYSQSSQTYQSPLFLNDPKNIESTVEYDPATNQYILSKKIGEMDYRPSTYMTMDEYEQYNARQSEKDYWKIRSREKDYETNASFIPSLNFGGEAFDRIFGNNAINITPQGSAELIFGFQVNKTDNPQLPEKLRKTPSFTFDEKIQMNVTGTIGDKLELGISYNTEATFDFENKTKIAYTGKEDDIIKKIEAGNVSFPLPGSLITGSQSLFGLKTELQFGRLTVTTVLSQQKGESSVINVEGGAQVSEFEITADEYDENRHFFLSHYFKDNYSNALRNLPNINSQVEITRIEVWVTNKTNRFDDSRNILAFMDLAESSENLTHNGFATAETGFPRNTINLLYNFVATTLTDFNNVSNVINAGGTNLDEGTDFEKIQSARLLTSREYTLNPYLGYISLNTALNADEVLAVAYEISTPQGRYVVGQFSTESTTGNPLILKLIKGTNLTPRYRNWELMMKNVYAIGAYQVEKQDFYLDVLFQNPRSGTPLNYLPDQGAQDVILLKMLGLDQCNVQNDQMPDGIFDYISGVTINPKNGRVFFPVLEPFGEDLRLAIERIENNKGIDIDESKYLYNELYDSTKTRAQQIAEKNKFFLSGSYKSSSGSEISLNAMNVPQGSVVVTAGGIKLQEGIDYTVDYTLGRVRIINPGLMESGTPIRVALESNSLFNFQTKTMVGSHFDYRVSDNFNLGATVLNLTERPLTQKVNFGDEPISNTMLGLNGSYRTESQFITTMVDKLPFLETKEKSSITIEGEFAELIPGSSRAIGKGGVSYIDDFEGSETSIEMKTFHNWVLSSTPSTFDEAALHNNLKYGHNRGKIAWYVIDPIFLRDNSSTPEHIKKDNNAKSSHYVREVYELELYPEKDNPNNIPTNIPVLNVAYYPREKGPYNYRTEGVNDDDGTLENPGNSWGGIMREVPTPDFEAANIEFIEFWLMDPYVEDSLNQGGDLYFNLGDISEDILKDSRKAFENGLPIPGEVENVDTTVWGAVTTKNSLNPGFDVNPESRASQDVGLDGLDTEAEIKYFKSYLDELGGVAYDKALKDPSNDDYHYYRGSDYDKQKMGILERYKKYNGMEGNSPTSEQSPEDYITSASTLPDKEDINDDNTLSTNERFFQYHVSLRRRDFEVGTNYIVDKRTHTEEFPNKTSSTVNWYLFKIPLAEFEGKYGTIDDFKSIRFMRMYLTNFEDSAILRFAKLELVRSEWRKYNSSLREASEGTSTPDEAEGALDISTVNIEENSQKTPVNYVLPPGIDRVIDPTQPQLLELNEQSMVLKVHDLADGDARAAYKNTLLDMRQYKRLKMEIHAEQIPDYDLKDNDLRVFIRLGSDYKNNYYEYEIPVVLTPHRHYDMDSEDDRAIVWPDQNCMDIDLEIFTDLKLARNDMMRSSAGAHISANSVYSIVQDNGIRVSVCGYPSLDEIRTVMIGVRNPSRANNSSDDGFPKSGEIWVNELRLTDFNNKGGWAANARTTIKLADFGTISAAGFTSTPGWGSIDQKVNERSMEEVRQIDLSSNLELGKFFPEKAGIRIPMYTGYSKTVIDPQYDPQNPDIEFKESMEHTPRSQRDSIYRLSQDFTERQSINFTNVGFDKNNKKPKPYSISNFGFTYAYSSTYSRNIDIKDFQQNQYRGAIGYNYTLRPKNVTPLRKIKALNKPSLSIIRDFNFYYLPSRISVRTDVDRRYDEKVLRPRIESLKMPAMVNKDFLWNRYYDINYDLARSLKLSFSAATFARIDEPQYGEDDYRVVKHDEEFYQHWKDSVMNAFMNGGRITHYNHQINASYTVPINKIRLLNWTSMTTKYTGNFAWDAAPLRRDGIETGNTIKNSYTASVSTQFNMLNLYNKVGYLQKINQKYSGRAKTNEKKETKEITFTKPSMRFNPDIGKTVTHGLKTEQIKVKIITEDGGEVTDFDTKILDANRVRITTKEEYRNATVEVTGTVEKKPNPIIFIGENVIRMAMAVRNISITYSQSQGSILPGYIPTTYMFGFDDTWSAPGSKYLIGLPDKEFPRKPAENGWLTRSTESLQNLKYLENINKSWNVRSTVEPIPNLRIDLTSQWSMTRNNSQNFMYMSDSLGFGEFEFLNYYETGTFSMSYIAIGTSFEKGNRTDKRSDAFDQFSSNREIVAGRLGDMYGYYLPDTSTGIYRTGYGGTAQQVLIPSFLAAYSGTDASKIFLDSIPSVLKMLPNWRITYDGLSKIEFMKKYFKTISLSHSYRCTYNINSYVSNDIGLIGSIDTFSNNRIPGISIQSVSINEQFAPLIGMDMTWNNNLTTRLEFKKSRNIALSLSNSLVTELKTNEYVVGIGYRFEEVQIIINNQRTGQKEFKSDLNVRGDFSIRDNKTMLHNLLEDSHDIQSGQKVYSVALNADYMLSDSFNLRFFIEKDINKPHTSLSFPTQNFNIGFSVRFTLIK
ncbi:MAG: cell surface protein SprA [Bacteroidales bacterium]|nr:cell surface protein SprA [Bacteroidales bacterium]